jgi:hypothetical protein
MQGAKSRGEKRCCSRAFYPLRRMRRGDGDTGHFGVDEDAGPKMAARDRFSGVGADFPDISDAGRNELLGHGMFLPNSPLIRMESVFAGARMR